ncbi:Ig-like domain-containing protein [Candidatus Cloacimonadota bacterium]
MKYFYLIMAFSIAFLCLGSSCSTDDDEYAGDVYIDITPSVGSFIWGNNSVVTVTMEDDELVDCVSIFIDDELVIEDHLAPYTFQWSTTQLQYGEHEIKATAEYRDNSLSTAIIVVHYIPCPLYETDLSLFEGISETDEQGNLTGNIDPDDWLQFGDNSFGPAYPNPASQVSNLTFNISEAMEVTAIIINQDHEIVEVVLDNQLLQQGDHTYYWVVPQNINDIYRCVIHTSTDLHTHGDILVQQ